MFSKKPSNLQVEYFLGEKPKKDQIGKKCRTSLFTMVVDLVGRPHFFVRAPVGLISWPRFFVGAAIGLAIGGAILTGREVVVGFSGLSLW